MRVLVTRPAPQADEAAAVLRAAGLDAVALPLIGIAPATDAAPLQRAWAALPSQRLAIFVSPNAVEHFMAARPADAPWPAGVLAAAPGPGTAQALRRLGVPAAQIVEPAADAGQFDSEALWQQLQGRDWTGAGVLVVRGDGGREWLADTLRAHGAQVGQVAAYRRVVPQPDAAGQALLRAALEDPARHLWIFSSSEAITHLARLAGAAVDWSRVRALATHPRIAQRAQQQGIRGVVTVAAADAAAVSACIQSMPP